MGVDIKPDLVYIKLRLNHRKANANPHVYADLFGIKCISCVVTLYYIKFHLKSTETLLCDG